MKRILKVLVSGMTAIGAMVVIYVIYGIFVSICLLLADREHMKDD